MSNEVMQKSALLPTYSRFPIAIVKGKNSYAWDDQGNEYLDFTSGIATCNLGHVPDSVQEAVQQQLNTLWHCSNLYQIPNQEKLAELLTTHTFGSKVFFANSGAEANEGAIKLARSYAQKVKQTNAFEVVTFSQSFHGRTLATLSATGQEKIQKYFAPLSPGFRYLPFNDMEALDQLITPDTCGVLVELVQGEGGVVPADEQWVKEIEKQCKANDVLFMIDEIQTGVGRTGTLYAYEQYDIKPDVITSAKGLGSGLPIGAVIANEKASQAFGPGSHGSTFGGNPLSMSAGIATLTYLTESEVLKDSQELAAYFAEKLELLTEKSEELEAVRGKGLLLGVVTKPKAIDLVNKVREHGVLLLIAGEHVLRILPPLTATKAEVDKCIAAIEKALES